MPLLIDGYNLLNATGIVGHGKDLTSLHRSRRALLGFLAASLSSAERSQAVIVFDAAGAPPGLPRLEMHEGITVHYSKDYADADAMLEELIAQHNAPRTLTVVSSDHRVQRAARRRRATAVDSERWYAELCASRSPDAPTALPSAKPTGKLTAAEVDYWLKRFSKPLENPAEIKWQPPATYPPQEEKEVKPDDPPPPDPKIDPDLADPFPPGYGEDLLKDD